MSVCLVRFWPLFRRLPLFNAWVTGWLYMLGESGMLRYRKTVDICFLLQGCDKIVHSGMMSDTCVMEEVFSPLLSLNRPLRCTEGVSVGNTSISMACPHLNSKGQITLTFICLPSQGSVYIFSEFALILSLFKRQ